jgi:hypothetical protein
MSADIQMYAPSNRAFRLVTVVFAGLLGAQSVWLLLTELSRPGIDRLPIDAAEAARAASRRSDALWAAWIGAIRGDLWGEAALTHADLLWATPGSDPQQETALQLARQELDKALGYAPHQADAWLLLAGLEQRYQSLKSDPTEALKMAYYTGPSERPSIPLRLLVATHSDATNDVEIQQFVRRDLRFLLTKQQKSSVAEAYADASPAGKSFIEQVVGEIDPAYLGLLRTGTQKP